MREIKILTEEDRLHLVITGYSAEDQARLLELLAEFSRSAKAPAKVEKLEEFEKIEPQPVDLSSAKEVQETVDKAAGNEELKVAYQNFLTNLTEKNEAYVYLMFKDEAKSLNSLSENEKKAFGGAFRNWFLKRYQKDPFQGNTESAKKKRRYFFQLYDRYLREEIASLETQYGLEKGTFFTNASDDQIDEAYELCRREMLKRCTAKAKQNK